MNTCSIHQAIDDFRRGKCIFYLTPAGGYPAVLTRHYVGRKEFSHGFTYITKYPQPPKFHRKRLIEAIQAAIDSGREVLVAEKLSDVLNFGHRKP